MNEERQKLMGYLDITAKEMRRRSQNKFSPETAHVFYGLDMDFITEHYQMVKEIVDPRFRVVTSDEELEEAVRNFNRAHEGLCCYLAYLDQGGKRQ